MVSFIPWPLYPGIRALSSRLSERCRDETQRLLLTGINPEFLYLIARALGQLLIITAFSINTYNLRQNGNFQQHRESTNFFN